LNIFVSKWSKIAAQKKVFFCWFCLGPPSYGIGATIRIGREMLCLPNIFQISSKYLKSLDIGLREVGAKRPLGGVNKVWRTDKHTKQKQIRNGKILLTKNPKKYSLRKLKSLSELTKVAWQRWLFGFKKIYFFFFFTKAIFLNGTP
jgi:hypothetical protein